MTGRPEYMTRRPRGLAEIARTPEERRAICRRVLGDRRARGGAPAPSCPTTVERSVRASQYLSGVVLPEVA